jgi:hypothetical protein
MRLLLALLFLSPFSLLAQEILTPKRCATAEVIAKERTLNPGWETDEQFEAWMSQQKQMRLNRVQAVVTLPVVFHIIHDNSQVGSGSNLLTAIIHQQLKQINKDFRNLSNSPYAVSADTEIQFGLAVNDPQGNPLTEPGINRIDRNTKGWTAPPYTVGYASVNNNYLKNTIKPNSIWDPNRYVNIWVLEMEAQILGIATFPASSTLSGLDDSETNSTAGVAVAPFTLGSDFSPGSCGDFTRGKTLTHELGHFFGLRHIWGDSNCGTDYCGDTPVHKEPNSGVPEHPKPNSCGTLDEMFENYMDYTNDVILNTFTADQKARMQTVLANSPRRNTLAASNAGTVFPVISNRVAFGICSGISVAESGISGTTQRYRDIKFNLFAEDKATGNATVNIQVSGNGINGFDYEVLTPTLNFVEGDPFKTITLRILDDAQPEGNTTLTVGFSINGNGVQAGSSNQSVTITIIDDDNITISQQPVTILSEDFSGSLAGWSFLSTSNAVNKFVVSNGGDAGGTGNCAYISQSTVAPFANTYNTSAAGAAVLRTPLINGTSFSNFQLSFKYKVRGDVQGPNTFIDYGRMTYSLPSAANSFYFLNALDAGPYASQNTSSGTPVINLPEGDFAKKQFYLGFYWVNDASGGNSPGWNIDDVVLTATGTNVETAVSNSFGFTVKAGTPNNFLRSTAGKIITTIQNSSEDLAGITASVTEAGNAKLPITLNNTGYLRSQKVIRIITASNNATASYQASFYFTTAELSNWTAIERPLLKILKLKEGVSLSGPINSSDMELVNPVFSDQTANLGYYVYTGNFTGGFSQFILVSPNFTLPVQLFNFDAKVVNREVQLNWRTSFEENNKGFFVERSTDGIVFNKMGWINGKGNTTSLSEYFYTDVFVQPNVQYYYRLHQLDFNNMEKFSVIRLAKIQEKFQQLVVSPNPASDKVQVFLSGASGMSDILLYNSKGQLVRVMKNVDVLNGPATLNTSGLSKGWYQVQVVNGGNSYSSQIILQ